MSSRKNRAIAAAALLRGDKPPQLAPTAEPKKAKPVKPTAPTAEQMKRGHFVEEAITERGIVSRDKIYRRHPRFETLAKDGTVTDDQLRALRFYREAWEQVQRSEMRCALDVEGRGGGGGVPLGIPAGMIGDYRVGDAEAALGSFVHTVRAIALHDMTFSDLAMQRYGSRQVDVISVGKGKVPATSYTKLAPRSGRHRELVRAEFLDGVRLLEVAVRPHLQTGMH